MGKPKNTSTKVEPTDAGKAKIKAAKKAAAKKALEVKKAEELKNRDPEADCFNRMPHPDTKDEDNLLECAPDDFDPKKHIPLKRANFKEEHQHLSHRADLAQRLVDLLRAKAEQSKKLGSGVERKGKAKLLKLQDSFAKLKAELEKQGVDTSELLGGDEDGEESTEE